MGPNIYSFHSQNYNLPLGQGAGVLGVSGGGPKSTHSTRSRKGSGHHNLPGHLLNCVVTKLSRTLEAFPSPMWSIGTGSEFWPYIHYAVAAANLSLSAGTCVTNDHKTRTVLRMQTVREAA